MADPLERLLTFCLGTFHTAFFVLVLVMTFYLAGSLGGLLANLNTLMGFALFGMLWWLTYWATSRAIVAVSTAHRQPGIYALAWSPTAPLLDYWRILTYAALWGGIDGGLFLAILLFFFALSALFRNPADVASFISLFAIILFGAVLALLIGALAGALLALLDIFLLNLARALFHTTTR